MKNKVIAAAAILFILGLFLGAFLSAYRLEASSPEGEISGGEIDPAWSGMNIGGQARAMPPASKDIDK